jgi:glycine/D-amino acid oxidase-like deaminating enzyme
MDNYHFDAIVIGGGFFGATIAIHLAGQKCLPRVAVIEREAALLQRASYSNQARVHNGYHYPRSFITAYRSRTNFPKFVENWPAAVVSDFTKLYAIARRNSKVTAQQFRRFCKEINAEIETVTPDLRAFFDRRLIEDVFEVKEYVFDTTCLAEWCLEELRKLSIDIILESQVSSVIKSTASKLKITTEANGSSCEYEAPLVFNCTYSGLNQFKGDFIPVKNLLKQEVTEIALIEMPTPLKNIGITVMDGPFFSTVPFPVRNLHTLSHVRYTPHLYWTDEPGIDPYKRLAGYKKETRFDRMRRDSARYVPLIGEAKYHDSLFEIKTVLVKNEEDDGRPILFKAHDDIPGLYSILGGKIDNIFDVIERIDVEFDKNY